MRVITDVWEWLGQASSWAILFALFIAWQIQKALRMIAEELFRRHQKEIIQIIPARGYAARLYVGTPEAKGDAVDRSRNRILARALDYEFLPVVAWGLKKDGSVTGLIYTTSGFQQAEALNNFEGYITSEYEKQLVERAERVREEDDALEKLKRMGLYDGSSRSGFHDWKAKAALRKFQESRGLPLTGKLDNATKQAIDLPLPVSYPVEVRLPTGIGLGEDTTAAEVIRLLVREGDTVCMEQPLIEVETNTAVLEIPTPCDGIVLNLTVGEGETIQVGSLIAVIGRSTG